MGRGWSYLFCMTHPLILKAVPETNILSSHQIIFELTLYQIKKEIECDIYSPFLFLTNFSVHSFLANNVIKFCQGRLLDFVKLQCTIFLLPTFLHKFALEELFRQIQKIPIYIATYIRQASRYEIILWKDNAPDLFYSLVNRRNTAKFYCSYVIQIVWKAKLLRGSKTYDDPNK